MRPLITEIKKITNEDSLISVPTKRLFRIKNLNAFALTSDAKEGDLFLIKRTFPEYGIARGLIFDAETGNESETDCYLAHFSSLDECDFSELEQLLSRAEIVR